MKFFNLFKSNKFKSDPKFIERLNADLDVCGFSEDLKRGFLFFLGYSIPILCENDPSEAEKLISLYSVPSGDFSKYGDLNDYVFGSAIYTSNHILHSTVLDNPDQLDQELRKVPLGDKQHIILQLPLIESMVNDFMSLKFKLGELTTFYTHLFTYMGAHLSEKGYSYKRSYEAGFAFYNMQLQMDVQGTRYLISVLTQLRPSLYKALTEYPYLHLKHKNELEANNIFSSIFFYFSQGIPDQILRPIHKFHQVLFYEPGSTLLRPIWRPFSEESILNVFINAATIRQTEFAQDKKIYLESKEIYKKELKNASLDINQFFEIMQKVLWEKHRLNVFGDHLNSGELMQMLGVLFYETSIHSMVLEHLDFKDFGKNE